MCVCACRAVRYRRRYLHEIDFDNIYITAQFNELDQQETSRGGASVLPITRREAETYISPCQYSRVCVCVPGSHQSHRFAALCVSCDALQQLVLC